MSARRRTAAHATYTASVIRRMAARNNVTASENDLFAHHVTRLSGDDVLLDDVEQMVIALQRAGVLSRAGGASASAVSARKQAVTCIARAASDAIHV
jgi:D-aminopeptidase